MATPARVKVNVDTTEFERGMRRMAAAMKRFGASVPRVHTLDPASPVYDRLARDFAMRAKADALEAEADTAPFVRRLYLRSVVRGLRRVAQPIEDAERVSA